MVGSLEVDEDIVLITPVVGESENSGFSSSLNRAYEKNADGGTYLHILFDPRTIGPIDKAAYGRLIWSDCYWSRETASWSLESPGLVLAGRTVQDLALFVLAADGSPTPRTSHKVP